MFYVIVNSPLFWYVLIAICLIFTLHIATKRAPIMHESINGLTFGPEERYGRFSLTPEEEEFSCVEDISDLNYDWYVIFDDV